MDSSNFREQVFQQHVNNALVSVKRILDSSRNPRLVEDQEHQYDDKYALASLLTNTTLVAVMNALERFLGLTPKHLEAMMEWAHGDPKQTVTLRFQALQTCTFLEMKEVPYVTHEEQVEERKVEETEEGGQFFGTNSSSKTSTTTVQNKVTTMRKEYHWTISVSYKLVVFAGASPGDGNNTHTFTLQSRDASTVVVICGSDKPPSVSYSYDPDPGTIDINITWLLQQISTTGSEKTTAACNFSIDRSNSKTCKTPRRNEQINEAVTFCRDLSAFAIRVRKFWVDLVEKGALRSDTIKKLQGNKSTLSLLPASHIFNPILPLFDRDSNSSSTTTTTPTTTGTTTDSVSSPSLLALKNRVQTEQSPLLSTGDLEKFLSEQIRTINEALSALQTQFPLATTDDSFTGIITASEATLVAFSHHLQELAEQYELAVDYIEQVLYKQLVAAIGKEVTSKDFDEFMSFHYQTKLYGPSFAPSPFCFAIRRPGHYPDGILSIERRRRMGRSSDTEEEKMQPVEMFTRKIPASKDTPPIRISLNAATTVELTGDRYLHGWTRNRFSSDSGPDYVLGARARQFSCFLVMVGTMVGPDQFEPKDAIVLQNKDEVLIPLLLNELPSAKEFKNAISSISPEQQQFAKSFREMQLGSSVFGVCVVRVKEQMEDLLKLPSGSLIKEMQLTQDLLSLFVDYQIPSDMLTCDEGEEDGKLAKINSVKEYTKSVLDVIQGEKDKQLEQARQQALMATEKSKRVKRANGDVVLAMKRSRRSSSSHSQHCGSFAAPLPQSRALPNDMTDQEYFISDSLLGPTQSIGNVAKSVASGSAGDFGGEGTGTSPTARSPTDAEENSDIAADADATSATLLPLDDFTKIPQQLDAAFDAHDEDSSVRATVLTTQGSWTKKHHANLLSQAVTKTLNAVEIKSEKDKAFDLLDALTRSGSSPLRHSELHVVVAVTHCFETNVMSSVLRDNINPIEKVEKSSLVVASTIFGAPPQALLRREGGHLARLQNSFPALFDGAA